MLGYVVLATTVFSRSSGKPIPDNILDMFLELSYQRIDLADEVFVINVDGYIGESTSKEIKYAKSKNKIINYLCDII